MFQSLLCWRATLDQHVFAFDCARFLGGGPFFIFLMVQFIRGIPRELDEEATSDGCNHFQFSLDVGRLLWTAHILERHVYVYSADWAQIVHG